MENIEKSRLLLPEMPLDIVFADSLPKIFTPPDELVEGVITNGGGSVLYGDSNSGKTFFVIDLSCAIARGIEWFGKKTDMGIVLYLAVESPASVCSRLQAYQQYHGVLMPNFVIARNPINLFDGDASTKAIIYTVKIIEEYTGMKVRLVVGDTLARMSAGANESLGQDMSIVIKHFDSIRNVCDTHFMLIHHCGKNVASGARGWSGVRGAVDTEIEVTASSKGRCAEITKQRDLNTKGERIGFQLEPVKLGFTKWAAPATSCIVRPIDAPPVHANKRESVAKADILAYLGLCKEPIKKTELLSHFQGIHSSTNVYRMAKELVQSGEICAIQGGMLAKKNSC